VLQQKHLNEEKFLLMVRPQPAYDAAVQAFGSDARVCAPARSYLHIRALSQPSLFVGALAQAYLLAQEKTMAAAAAITTQTTIKAVLVAMLLAFGGRSACSLAWTTVVAQACGTGILLWQVRAREAVRFPTLKDLKSSQLWEQSALLLKTLVPLVFVYLSRFVCHFLIQVRQLLGWGDKLLLSCSWHAVI
jgi:Na+-driven multidrug efflux pump